MNLSHAVAVISYICFMRKKSLEKEERPPHRAVNRIERSKLLEYIDELLKISDYHIEKQHIAYKSFENILSRGYITGREVTTLMGVFKWVNLQLERIEDKK